MLIPLFFNNKHLKEPEFNDQKNNHLLDKLYHNNDEPFAFRAPHLPRGQLNKDLTIFQSGQNKNEHILCAITYAIRWKIILLNYTIIKQHK